MTSEDAAEVDRAALKIIKVDSPPHSWKPAVLRGDKRSAVQFGLFQMSLSGISRAVQDHYADSQDPLLLSTLGTKLQKSGLWPIEGEERQLADVIETSSPDLALVRDPSARAYVVVVPKGRERLADEAIERRHRLQELRTLPRPLLLAFCVNTDSPIYVQRNPPHRYVIGEPEGSGFLLVEQRFRSPGLFLDFNRQLDVSAAERLLKGIRDWEQAHGVELGRTGSAEKRQVVSELSSSGSEQHANALARLLAAQPVEYASKLVVPLDIAVALSRLK